MRYIGQSNPSRQVFTLLSVAFALTAHAATVQGTITDSLGAVISNARVELINNTKLIASTTANAIGRYQFRDVAASRYQVRASAPLFDLTTSKSSYVGEGATANVDLLLAIGRVSEAVTV